MRPSAQTAIDDPGRCARCRVRKS